MKIRFWTRWLFFTFMSGITSYIYGILFLILQPITFYKFVQEYKNFADRIDDQDHIATSGFYQLPRRIRRQMRRNVKKGMDV